MTPDPADDILIRRDDAVERAVAAQAAYYQIGQAIEARDPLGVLEFIRIASTTYAEALAVCGPVPGAEICHTDVNNQVLVGVGAFIVEVQGMMARLDFLEKR